MGEMDEMEGGQILAVRSAALNPQFSSSPDGIVTIRETVEVSKRPNLESTVEMRTVTMLSGEFKPGKPVIIISSGYLQKESPKWVREMANALSFMDSNVIGVTNPTKLPISQKHLLKEGKEVLDVIKTFGFTNERVKGICHSNGCYGLDGIARALFEEDGSRIDHAVKLDQATGRTRNEKRSELYRSYYGSTVNVHSSRLGTKAEVAEVIYSANANYFLLAPKEHIAAHSLPQSQLIQTLDRLRHESSQTHSREIPRLEDVWKYASWEQHYTKTVHPKGFPAQIVLQNGKVVYGNIVELPESTSDGKKYSLVQLWENGILDKIQLEQRLKDIRVVAADEVNSRTPLDPKSLPSMGKVMSDFELKKLGLKIPNDRKVIHSEKNRLRNQHENRRSLPQTQHR